MNLTRTRQCLSLSLFLPVSVSQCRNATAMCQSELHIMSLSMSFNLDLLFPTLQLEIFTLQSKGFLLFFLLYLPSFWPSAPILAAHLLSNVSWSFRPSACLRERTSVPFHPPVLCSSSRSSTTGGSSVPSVIPPTIYYTRRIELQYLSSRPSYASSPA